MKKLLLALAIGASISTGASAVTCGENQQPDYTNSYCVDDPQATTTYSNVYDAYNQAEPKEKEEFIKDACDQLYQTFLTQLIDVRNHTTLICDKVCKVQRSSFLPLGELSKVEGVDITLFNQSLRWIAKAVMVKDPELTSGDSIYFDFLKTCRSKPGTVLKMIQHVVDTRYNGDVNRILK